MGSREERSKLPLKTRERYSLLKLEINMKREWEWKKMTSNSRLRINRLWHLRSWVRLAERYKLIL
jgi:hypothetical protein